MVDEFCLIHKTSSSGSVSSVGDKVSLVEIDDTNNQKSLIIYCFAMT